MMAELRRMLKTCVGLMKQVSDAPLPLGTRVDGFYLLSLAFALLVALERQACGIDPRCAADLADEAIAEAATLLDRVAGMLAAEEKEEAHGAPL